MLKNSQSHYGAVSVTLHWLVALMVLALFAVGFWMVDLTYYSQWYRTAPHWHKSIGVVLFLLMLLRVLWRLISPPPAPLSSHRDWEKRTALAMQLVMYLGIFTLAISGYLISTEDSRPIEVFGWFEVPAMGELFSHQADIAGEVHEYTAYSLITLALVHALAALKHHFLDNDATLRRILGRKP